MTILLCGDKALDFFTGCSGPLDVHLSATPHLLDLDQNHGFDIPQYGMAFHKTENRTLRKDTVCHISTKALIYLSASAEHHP